MEYDFCLMNYFACKPGADACISSSAAPFALLYSLYIGLLCPQAQDCDCSIKLLLEIWSEFGYRRRLYRSVSNALSFRVRGSSLWKDPCSKESESEALGHTDSWVSARSLCASCSSQPSLSSSSTSSCRALYFSASTRYATSNQVTSSNRRLCILLLAHHSEPDPAPPGLAGPTSRHLAASALRFALFRPADAPDNHASNPSTARYTSHI